ncbi:efflux RND transporter periplasmic adaptor subunit [Pontibacter sp. 172403-2]|uniref:efflux RND transporter periplasmic adaptor subunit n=1 Tax=Pontibacter rufus TaxID=2791028 RepID=UPI0018AFD0AA|nr:efflux RND transporter periplasmic adaptor subunit [Pontibacter sp. 172403-2]MBF9254937.1 efflux RND transporter periplasmic adaptor subunit [Pontibacter sp. 172403-2]
MRRWIIYLLLLIFVAAGAVACKEQVHEEAHAASETTYTCPMHPQIVQSQPGSCPICGMDLVPVSQQGSKDGALMLSDRQMALGNIKVSPAGGGSVGSNTILTGRLALDQTQTEVISSRAAGRVERLYIKETGKTVKKGQPLYELYSEQLLTLQREYLLALAQNRELGSENPRFASILEAARKKLLLYGLSEAQINKLAKSGRMDARVTFLAPESGVVTEIAAAEGQYIAEGNVLYRLAKLGTIWVEAELYPQEIVEVSTGDPIRVVVQGFAQEPVAAKVAFLSPELRAGSQVALLRAELPNKEGLYLPGMQAEVILPGADSAALTIPADAVIREEQGSHVWVQTGENTFEPRMITLGEVSADRVAILTGLKAGDKVVTSGAYLLYSEYKLKKGSSPMAGMKM